MSRYLTRSALDERDRALLSERAGLLAAKAGPRVGDYVEFADGVTRRISHIWRDEPVWSCQTSAGGSFYLAKGGSCSFSGGLYPGIPADTLTLTTEVREGSVWFFHHNYAEAGNGVDTTIPFRVFRCALTTHEARHPF